jgi:hypothetical protein
LQTSQRNCVPSARKWSRCTQWLAERDAKLALLAIAEGALVVQEERAAEYRRVLHGHIGGGDGGKIRSLDSFFQIEEVLFLPPKVVEDLDP